MGGGFCGGKGACFDGDRGKVRDTRGWHGFLMARILGPYEVLSAIGAGGTGESLRHPPGPRGRHTNWASRLPQ